MVSQVKGNFEAKDSRITDYLKLVHSLRACFGLVKVSHVSRGQNSYVDSMAAPASSVGTYIPRIISVELLEYLSIDYQCCVAATSTASPSWMDPIISFISDGALPIEQKKSEKVRRKSQFDL